MVSMFTTSFSFFGRKPKTTVLRLSDNQPEGYSTVMAGRASVWSNRDDVRYRIISGSISDTYVIWRGIQLISD